MPKVDWKAETIEFPVKLSLKTLCGIILNLTADEQIELIGEILCNGGKVFEKVKEFVNEE